MEKIKKNTPHIAAADVAIELHGTLATEDMVVGFPTKTAQLCFHKKKLES